MKKLFFTFYLALPLACCSQGTFVFDQQSSTDETYSSGGARIQFYGFVGQSFTPSLSTVGFIRVKLYDMAPANGVGATLVMNLRSNAINGPILGTTTLVLGNGFSGSTNFIFPNAVPVSPSLTYFFETTVQAGDNWGITSLDNLPGDNYPNGFMYAGPNTFTGGDLWFREGIVVPEPASISLVLIGVVSLVLRKRTTKTYSK